MSKKPYTNEELAQHFEGYKLATKLTNEFKETGEYKSDMELGEFIPQGEDEFYYEGIRSCLIGVILTVPKQHMDYFARIKRFIVNNYVKSSVPIKMFGALSEGTLEELGWTVECESPFELRHEDGSFASGQAAQYVIDGIEVEQVNTKPR